MKYILQKDFMWFFLALFLRLLVEYRFMFAELPGKLFINKLLCHFTIAMLTWADANIKNCLLAVVKGGGLFEKKWRVPTAYRYISAESQILLL